MTETSRHVSTEQSSGGHSGSPSCARVDISLPSLTHRTNLDFPQTRKVRKSVLNPISGSEVDECINVKIFFKLRIKNIIKRIIKKGVRTPDLYYDEEMHFAFFPRQDDEWLNEFYVKQGKFFSENSSEMLNVFNSPAKAHIAEIMLDFAEIKDGIDVCVDYGAGSGWLSKAMTKRTNASVKALDVSIDSMSHLRGLTDAILPLRVNDYFAPEQPRFDFLGCMDTFEHLNDPLSALKQIYEKANKGASVFLSVPNFDSYFSRIHLGCHPYYVFPQHLNYFTSKALAYLSELAGFKVRKQAVVTLPTEIEYVSRSYTKQMAPVGGAPLWDILNNGIDGERLFILLEK